jgi:hypothetical protein
MTCFDMNDIIWMTSFPWACRRHSRGTYLFMSTWLSGEDVLSISLTLSFHFRFNHSTTKNHDRWQLKVTQNQQGMEGPSPAGAILRKSVVHRTRRRRHVWPVINRTPAQAAAARLMPKPPNLETYAAALSRDEMPKTVILELSLCDILNYQ